MIEIVCLFSSILSEEVQNSLISVNSHLILGSLLRNPVLKVLIGHYSHLHCVYKIYNEFLQGKESLFFFLTIHNTKRQDLMHSERNDSLSLSFILCIWKCSKFNTYATYSKIKVCRLFFRKIILRNKLAESPQVCFLSFWFSERYGLAGVESLKPVCHLEIHHWQSFLLSIKPCSQFHKSGE